MAVPDVFASAICSTVSLGHGKRHSLFVDPDCQRGGIGRSLVAHMEAHARTIGLVELHLSSSLTAHPFYARLGYRDIRFEPHTDGSTWLMAKPLA
jgi:putative acetyltransferase